MNLDRLQWWTVWTTIAICMITVTLQLIAFLFQVDWWWLAVLPTIVIPNIVMGVAVRRANAKTSAKWPVAAVLRRPIGPEEKSRLEGRSLMVDNMYVHGVRFAPSASEALVRLEKTLTDCLTGPYEVEELAAYSPGTARRVRTLAGRADQVIAELLERNHEGHRQGERP